MFKGAEVSRENGNKKDDFSKIYIDLDAGEDEQIIITDTSEKAHMTFISILDLLDGDPMMLSQYPKKYYKKLGIYKNQIMSYQYSVIQITDVMVDVATEIFTRINVGGKSLTLFEIMVAKTFDKDKNFDLSEKYDELVGELQDCDYETISNTVILQTIATIISGECSKKIILKIDKEKFIDTWDIATNAIKMAVEYFRNVYQIPVSKLLPYPSLLVPFAYFFAKTATHNGQFPKGNQKKYLQDFFWRCSLGERYTSGLESKLAQDIKRIDKIISGELPFYDWMINSSVDFIKENGGFSTGRSYIKAILCIFTSLQPRSFGDYDYIVNVRNNWLRRADSKNYHHFFPKAYLKNTDDPPANHIANITIVDDYLNKSGIGAKPPSVYMKKIAKNNEKLSDTMKTHLIGDLAAFGVWENDYNLFFNSRLRQISKEIKKRIIEQAIDRSPQDKILDDQIES